MKKLLALLLILILGLTLVGCGVNNPEPDPDQVDGLLDKLQAGITDGDWDQVMSCYADTITIIQSGGATNYYPNAEYRIALILALSTMTSSYQVTNRTISVNSSTDATVTCVKRYDLVFVPQNINTEFTLSKTTGTWKITVDRTL
jgi:hypothetical protein